jgi:uncharacterized protein YcbX
VPSVSRLAIAPVKGLGLAHPEEVTLEEYGVTENRRFHLVDEGGRFFNLLRNGAMVRVVPAYDAARDRLRLSFPDGSVADGVVELDEPVTTDFYGRAVSGRVVSGPWAGALSRYAGVALRLVKSDRPGAAVDRSRGAVSLLSDASLEELGRRVGSDSAVDARRFRMLVGVAGTAPHEEEAWIGREVRIGGATARLLGPVGRCAITTQNPETGERDLDTLRVIRSYRGLGPDDGIDFGVYGVVVAPGRIRVGDPVQPIEPALARDRSPL